MSTTPVLTLTTLSDGNKQVTDTHRVLNKTRRRNTAKTKDLVKDVAEQLVNMDV